MSRDPTDDPASTAIEQLEQFGLSTYAARTFVALASLGRGTAREVSRVSAVPRTRVYDVIDELHEHGLVDIQHSSPKEFCPISGETASRTFEQEFQHRTELMRTAISELESVERQAEQRGVWTVGGRDAVTDRVLEFFESAEEEIVYMTVDGLLTEELLAGLHQAAERDVSINIAGISDEVRDRIQDDIPKATSFASLWVWSDTPAGRLMMVDGRKTLVSVLVGNDTLNPTERRSETAIWGQGQTNSLVAVLKAIFTWQLDSEEGRVAR